MGSSDPPVRDPMAYAIRQLCDIARPPGGRLNLGWGPKAPRLSGYIRVHPANKKNKKSSRLRLLAILADEWPCPVQAGQSEKVAGTRARFWSARA